MPQCNEADRAEGCWDESYVLNLANQTNWFAFRCVLLVHTANKQIDKLSPSAANLLASIGDDTAFSRSSPNPQHSRQSLNSISLPKYKRPSTIQPRSSTAPGTEEATASVQRLIAHAKNRRSRQEASSKREPGQMSAGTADELQKHRRAQDLSRQITRRWKAGDVYAPHDLSSVEMGKWKRRSRPLYDVFDVLDFKPLENYRVRPPPLLNLL